MKAYTFKEDFAGIMEVRNTLHSLQEFVGGLIEVISLTEELDLICNDEGKINGLPPTAAWLDHDDQLLDVICGDCLVCRHDGEGGFASIKESDLPVIHDIMVRCITV